MNTEDSWDKLTDALVGTYEEDILDGLIGAYQSLEARVEAAYKASQRQGASKFPLQRLLTLRKELEQQLATMQLPKELSRKVEKALADGQQAADYWAAIEINKIDAASDVLGVGFSPGMAQQNPEALVAAAQRQSALSSYALGGVDPQAFDVLRKHAIDLRGRIMGAVEFHLAQGDSWTSLRKTLRDSLALTKARAQMVARTEMGSAMVQGMKTRYEKEGIEYIQIIATRSSRTCGYCAPRHGYVYEIGEALVKLHPNCGCTSIPWKEEWVKQGLVDPAADAQSRQEVLKELEAAGKKPIDGPAPFERSLGLDKPPKPFWKPPAISKPKRKTRRKAKQVETPKAESPKDFLGLIAERVAAPSRSTVKGGDVQRLFEELKGRDGLEGEAMDKVLKFMEQEKTSVLFTGGRALKTQKQADYIINNKAFRESLARDYKRDRLSFSGQLHASLGEMENPRSSWNKLNNIVSGDRVPSGIGSLKNSGRVAGHTYDGASFVTIRARKENDKSFSVAGIGEGVVASLEQAASGKPLHAVASSLDKGQRWVPILLHELGHNIYDAQTPIKLDRLQPPLEGSGYVKRIIQRGIKGFRISKYGLTNVDELFAESFCAYALAPSKLREVSPATYKWVDSVLRKVIK